MNNIKKRLLSILLAVAMLCGLCVPTAFAAEGRYSDTKGHWAEKSIDRWSEYAIVQGNDGAFDPNGALTRAQMAVIFARLLALPDAENAGFTDVPEGAWYADGINRCYAAGIMLGDDGKAMPNDPISREQTIVMLCRALGIEAKADADLSAYTDADQVSSYAVGYVAAMVENGMVLGTSKTTLSPDSNITRGAVVTILDRGIAVYANEDNATVDAKDADGLILIAADNVTVKNAPKGTSVLVCQSAAGTKVNGKTVAAGTNYTATEQSNPSYRPPAGPRDLTVAAADEIVPSGTYRNVTIGPGVGDGEVNLENVTITGNLIVQGGGSSSIKLKDCTVWKVILDKTTTEASTQQPRLELTNTPVDTVEVAKPAIIEAKDSDSAVAAVEAKADVTVKGTATKVETVTVLKGAADDMTLTLVDAKVKTVAAEAPVIIDANGAASPIDEVKAKADITLMGEGARVDVIVVSENSENTTNKPVIDVRAGTVDKVVANQPAEVKGDGTVANVEAKAAVTVASATVEKVTVTTAAAVTVSGNETIEVAVETTEATSIITTNKNVSFSSTQDTVNVVTKANEEDEGTPVTHIHKWGAGVVDPEPDCTRAGTKTYTCVAEGCTNPATTKTETVPALGHTWNDGEVTKAATCTETGVKTYTCSSCSDTRTEEIPALGHTEVVDEAVAPTCTETGLTEGKHCSVCDAVLKAQEEVAALGHTEVVDEAVEATCTKTGLTEGKHCSVCNAVLVAQETVPVIPHTWDSGVVTKQPTETTEGVKTYTCIVCETTRTETIPVITEEETKLVVSVKLDPTGNYITDVNGKELFAITDHFENTVTVSFADLTDVPEDAGQPSYDLRFFNCVFEENLYVDYTDNYLRLWFDRCTFKNGAKLIMKGDGSKFNDLMFDVIYDEASYEGGSHCIIWFDPAAAGRDPNYLICANRGQSIAVTGEQNATFRVGGKVDLSGLTVTPEKRIQLDAYLTGTELCTINLGNNKAEAVTPGVYFITADKGNVNPVTIADGIDPDTVGVRVNNVWQQQAPTSFLYNIRLEVEDGLGWLRWDLIRGKDALDADGNPRQLHYTVSARAGFYTYEYEAAEGGRLLTFPADNYTYFTVIPYYWQIDPDTKESKKINLNGGAQALTVKAETGTTYPDKAYATFELCDPGPGLSPTEYVVKISGLSGYDAYLMYVDHEYFKYSDGVGRNYSLAQGPVSDDTVTTMIPYEAVNCDGSTYRIYGIKNYRLADGTMSYTVDCLREPTAVPKADSDVPTP